MLRKLLGKLFEKREPRTGRETVKKNFSLRGEARFQTDNTLTMHHLHRGQGTPKHVYEKAFGTKRKIPGTTHIGTVTGKKGTTHWHKDRRIKEGTKEDREE